MDLSHKGFERKSDRSESLFNPNQLLNVRHAAVFERVLIDRLKILVRRRERSLAVEGTLLCCAVLFGALIDRRLWPYWFAASRGDVVSTKGRGRGNWQQDSRCFASGNSDKRNEDCLGASRQCFAPLYDLTSIPLIPRTGRIWIDLIPEKGEPLRWVADPLTEALMLFWQRGRFNSIARFDHVDAVAEAFGASSWEHQNKLKLVIKLHRAARAKWQMRMPEFLIEAVDRRRQSVILPATRWVALLEPERCQKEVWFEPKPIAPKFKKRGEIVSLIEQLFPKGQNHTRRHFAVAAGKLADDSCSNDIAPVKRQVLLWAATRLAPARDLRQRKKRLAPSTVALRGERLLRFLKFTFDDQDPNLLSTENFTNEINNALSQSQCPGITRDDLVCFTDWNSINIQDQSVTLSHGVRAPSGVRAGIISMADYRAIISRFSNQTRKGGIARLITMLGFRAGLRWDEVEALAVGDLLVEGSIIELTVRPNSDRRTKTLGSRRVLPLHVLMEPEECRELISWWRSRRAERNPHAQSHRDASEHWRLFPHYETLMLVQVKKDIEAAIRGVTGDSESLYHVLRHTFASAMIATFLLPDDYRNYPPCPQIDPELVSLTRRDRIAPALLGVGQRTRDGLRAVASLLGHSGEKTTIRSYFHLHDWLVGIYVARPRVQPRLTTSLISTITGRSAEIIERENRYARSRNPSFFDLDLQDSKRKKKKGDDPKADAAIMWPLFSVRAPQSTLQSRNPLPVVSEKMIEAVERENKRPEFPSWQALNVLFCSIGESAEKDACQQPELISPIGAKIADALLQILAVRTSSKISTSTYRFLEVPRDARKQRVRLLSPDERHRLERLYAGLSTLTWSDLSKLCATFRTGYDRAHGVIRMHIDEASVISAILERASCSLDNIDIHKSIRSATMRIGSTRRMDRGFVRALIFASAVEAVHAAHQASEAD